MEYSLAEWIQAWASLVGVIGLLWTLNLQRKTLQRQQVEINAQNESLQLQKDQNRISKLPIFDIESGPIEDINQYYENPYISYQLVVTLRKNWAYKVMVAPKVDGATVENKDHHNLIGDGEKIYLYIDLKKFPYRDSPYMLFHLHFSDADGLPYDQFIYLKNDELSITLPRDDLFT